ncbi:GGDEF domain-containing protein [Noviherbaspirillum sedimenti]|uniref:diguanylate cyclase n=1 Tax=Noviherbaspirillum sedimenti TaxID=2320865 RepID=A0A3A3G826_9BURK|nr:GGDEF domain-containing protein [Noviherbaspirillum sedimenti]RJG02712.1 GGDEF domain-containing protein [Noviherbaspirillum sedimenti]
MSDQAKTAIGGDTLRLRYETIEARRRTLLVYLGNGVASVFLFGFGIANLLEDRYTLAWFSLIHGCITLGNILLLRVTRNPDWASYGFAYGLLALFVFLTITGGVDHTGPLWGYPMVAVALSILRARLGLAIIVAMLCIALLLFLAPPSFIEVAPYSTAFKVRYTATFLALILFTWLHEFARARSQAELIRVSAQIDRLSQTDVLTDLPNRRYMLERLEAENSRYRRHQRPYAILYGDVDDFKQINDRYGHQAGDEALCAIAQALRANLRQHDVVCRWGGEEFLVLLPETGADIALEVAEKLRAAIAAVDFRPADGAHRLTMSFGLHTVLCQDSVDHFIQQADRKLYHAKQTGKNRAVAELATA